MNKPSKIREMFDIYTVICYNTKKQKTKINPNKPKTNETKKQNKLKQKRTKIKPQNKKNKPHQTKKTILLGCRWLILQISKWKKKEEIYWVLSIKPW